MLDAPVFIEKQAELEEALPELEEAMSYSLADAIREGSTVTDQMIGEWEGLDGSVCALSAAALAAKARHFI